MKHLRALLIKFIMVTAVLYIVLGLVYGVTFGDILGISLFVTVAAYLIGDLFILPRYGNAVATLADFGLAYLGIWLVGGAFIEVDFPLGLASFYATIGIVVGEWFFHKYMLSQILPDEDPDRNRELVPRERFVTEFAEEPDGPDTSIDKIEQRDKD
ncbi:YndM family protein [Alkalihalobacillus sp. AL-G]|uniref:YndM family protein n=1 Tax=Alkalihalobacillus sp. AL-G TaxID=2926399 RepID=UPI00272AA137|nr:YndM family protein [Alkalihalobacillus sp. AL-G]WLD94648.1 YndM family protein [Alkalihalobacillus sp. AL-G]